MKLDYIGFDELPVNALFQSYLNDYSQLSGFFTKSPFQWPAQNGEPDLNSGKISRDQLVELLREINTGYGAHQQSLDQIDRLKDPEAKVVVTGQQMVIFGGSLFLILKAISVIVWARQLEQRTGKPVVPVFWLADEDHDYDEVTGLSLPGDEGVEHLKLDFTPDVPHSIGNLKPGQKTIELLLDQIFEVLPETDFSSELRELLASSYQSGNLKEGFARLFSELFSKQGLVLVESNNPAVKKALSEPICRAVQEATAINEELEARSAEVEARFHRQAHVQPTTLFMHDPAEGRVRLNRANGSWWTDTGQEWSSDQLCKLAEDEPWKFSPNVFLRPVLQDWLLPTIGYVAGPGEVAYYAQLGKVYDLFDQKMPAILPRISATVIEPAISRIMEDLPFTFADYSRRIEDLEKAYLEWSTPDNLDEHFQSWQQELEALMQQKSDLIEKYDPSLRGSAEKMTVNFNKQIDKLHQKLRKSLRQKDEIQLKRIKRIKLAAFPEDRIQERVVSWIYFTNKFGFAIWDEIADQLCSSTHLPDKHLLLFP